MIKASIHGRLGGEPIERTTRAGASMWTASVAVTVGKPNEDPVTEWISVVAFASVGEVLAQHSKGDVVTAIGTLSRSSYTARDGAQRTVWSLCAEQMLSVRTVRSGGAERQTTTRTPRAPGRPQRPPMLPAPGPLADDGLDDLWPDGEP